jgi:ribosomal protein L40E
MSRGPRLRECDYERSRERRAYVEATLGTQTICTRCAATLATYADNCSTAGGRECQGQKRIDAVNADFERANPC